MKSICKIIFGISLVCFICSCTINKSKVNNSEDYVEKLDIAIAEIPNYSENLIVNFEGTWVRTDIHSSLSSELNIENQTTEGFDFSIFSTYFFNVGDFESNAVFIDKNKAVCSKFIDELGTTHEIEIIFTFQDNVLTIDGISKSLPVGAHVTISGDYVKGEPNYINKENYELIFPNKEAENTVKEMLNGDIYYYFEFAAHHGYIDSIKLGNTFIYTMRLPTTVMNFAMWITDENKIYIWDLSNFPILYTNDKNYSTNEMRMVAEKELGLQEDIKVTFKEINSTAILDNKQSDEYKSFTPIIKAYASLEKSGYVSYDKDILHDSFLAKNKGITKVFNLPVLSYAFYDISNDGSPELIIAGDDMIVAIYALQNGKATIVGEWSVYIDLLLDDESKCVIYINSPMNMGYEVDTFYKLDKNNELVELDSLITTYGYDEKDEYRKLSITKNIIGKPVAISDNEYFAILGRYGVAINEKAEEKLGDRRPNIEWQIAMLYD
jgi:hypothetical protein